MPQVVLSWGFCVPRGWKVPVVQVVLGKNQPSSILEGKRSVRALKAGSARWAGLDRYQALKQLARKQRRILEGAPGMLKRRVRPCQFGSYRSRCRTRINFERGKPYLVSGRPNALQLLFERPYGRAVVPLS